MNNNADNIKSLREMADWLEARPEFPHFWFTGTGYLPLNTKEEVAAAVHMMDKTKKVPGEAYMTYSRAFASDLKIDVYIEREKVCSKVQTGTRTVPAKPATPEMVVPVYEWQCGDPILAADKTTPQPTQPPIPDPLDQRVVSNGSDTTDELELVN